eukprot:693113-Amphidinium_carterae.1
MDMQRLTGRGFNALITSSHNASDNKLQTKNPCVSNRALRQPKELLKTDIYAASPPEVGTIWKSALNSRIRHLVRVGKQNFSRAGDLLLV